MFKNARLNSVSVITTAGIAISFLRHLYELDNFPWHHCKKLAKHFIRVYTFIVGACEASRFNSNSNRTISIPFESDGRFEIYESAALAVVPQTTFTVQQKKLQLLRRGN